MVDEPLAEQPAAEPAPAIPDLARIGSPKTATFLCVKRPRASEYVDALFEPLRLQFLIPADAIKATELKIGGVSVVAFSFPTNPGFVEYEVLGACLERALTPDV